MLLGFAVRNYKSFRNETVFSFEAASRQRDMKYTLLREKIGSKTYTSNSAKIVYGPNAGGKTNMISAFDAFRSIVLRNNIRNSEEHPANSQRIASSRLELMPNMHEDPAVPTSFEISFVENGMHLEYRLDVDVGGFLNPEYPRRVTREVLAVNDCILFDRVGNNIEWKDIAELPKSIHSMLLAPHQYSVATDIAGNSARADELLLGNGFRAAVSMDLADIVIDWFRSKLIVLYAARDIELPVSSLLRYKQPASDQNIFLENKTVLALAKKLGLSARHLGFPVRDGEIIPELCSMINIPGENEKHLVLPARAFESLGTVRMADLLHIVLSAIGRGAVLLVDELDASMHPVVTGSILNLFHDNAVNVNRAQLVFSTHNPVYLDRSMCRRDELWFIERENDESGSKQWSLADFGTKGRDGVRNNSDYMRNYLKGTYGAIAELDFGDLATTEGEAL